MFHRQPALRAWRLSVHCGEGALRKLLASLGTASLSEPTLLKVTSRPNARDQVIKGSIAFCVRRPRYILDKVK